MSIDFSKFTTTPTKIDFGKFIISKPASKVETKYLPSFLGGGAYNQVVGNANELFKTPRKNGADDDETTERHHIIPVEFGGSSETDKNILALPIDAHKRITEAERQISKDYNSKAITLGQARTKIMGLLQKELDAQQGVKQGTAANFLSGLKDTFLHPIKSVKEAINVNPQTTQAVKDVAESTKVVQPNIKKTVTDFAQAIVDAEKQGGERIADVFVTPGTKSEKAGQVLEAVAGTAGVIFSPITAAFSASKNIPIIGSIASIISLPLAVIGDELTNLTNEGLNALIASKKIKKEDAENIRQGVNEVASLAGQIYAGGKMFKGKEVKVKELETKYGKTDAETIIKKAEERATSELKAKVAELTEQKPKIEFNKFVKKEEPMVTKAIEDYVFYNKRKSLTPEVLNKIDELAIKPTKEIKLYRDGEVDVTKPQSWSKNPAIGDNPISKTFKPEEILIDLTDPKAKNLFSGIGKESLEKYIGLESEVIVKSTGKISGVAKSISAKAVEQGMVKNGYTELADYSSSTIKEQSKIAEKYTPEQINDIATGKAPLPKEMKPGTALSIAEDFAKTNKDTQLMADLAKSPLATKLSESASELSLSRMREQASAVTAMREVIKKREKAYETKTGKKVSEAKKKEVKKMKEEIKKETPTKSDWQAFVESIKCK